LDFLYATEKNQILTIVYIIISAKIETIEKLSFNIFSALITSLLNTNTHIITNAEIAIINISSKSCILLKLLNSKYPNITNAMSIRIFVTEYPYIKTKYSSGSFDKNILNIAQKKSIMPHAKIESVKNIPASFIFLTFSFKTKA